MDEPTEVIDYSTFMRAGAEVIVARKDGHGCVNDYEHRLRDSMSEYDYYDIAEQNLECVRNGSMWYPHLFETSHAMMDLGVVMPIV